GRSPGRRCGLPARADFGAGSFVAGFLPTVFLATGRFAVPFLAASFGVAFLAGRLPATFFFAAVFAPDLPPGRLVETFFAGAFCFVGAFLIGGRRLPGSFFAGFLGAAFLTAAFFSAAGCLPADFLRRDGRLGFFGVTAMTQLRSVRAPV